ncbi:MAG: 3-hydroxy-9,10-secoandrosta,3,5(10)-triene-9,17-dione monooxygenase reductase component [Acidimicrobiaceae bacterium]
MTADEHVSSFDEAKFRQVLGHYPTGVVLVTAIADDGQPAGLAIGSFTSVSLDPPLVAFFPDKKSSSWPRIETAGSFCVNILGEAQEDLSRVFASKGADKFASIGWRPGRTGAPVINDVIAWIECTIERVDDAGDHWIVLGRVVDLEVGVDGGPLLFFRGGYGRYEV